MMKLKKILNVFAVFALLMSATVEADEIESPVDMLKRTSDEVIKVLNEKRADIDADPSLIYQIVDDYILPHLDDVTLAKLALGKNWRKANNDQKIEFVDQFRILLIRTYSKSLQEFSDEKINFFPVKMKAGDTRVTVKSEVVQGGGPVIPVNYRLRIKDDAWKVYDIKIDGVSLVTNYRGTFAQEMRKGGIAGVLKMLKAKNAKIAKTPTEPETSTTEKVEQSS